jgi:opacity protein-like surface antigen
MIAVSSAAHAQENRFYVAGTFGSDAFDDETISGANAAAQRRDINVEFDNGGYYGVALGLLATESTYGRVRGEVEASFRSADVQALALNGVARNVAEGSEVSVASGMINGFYDTPVYFDRFRLYAGAGLGIAGVDHEIRYLVANPAATGGNLQIIIPSSEMTVAYQFIGGAEVALSPSWSLTADVRYFDAGDVQVERYIGNTIINGTATNIGTLDSVLDADLSSVTASAGIRYRF